MNDESHSSWPQLPDIAPGTPPAAKHQTMSPPLNLHKRLADAGFDPLVQEYNLLNAGIVTMRVPQNLYRPTVLGPTSCDPLPGDQPFHRLTDDEHRRLLVAMFGEDPGVGAHP